MIAVTGFSDASLAVVQGLKTRFASSEFSGVRIGTKKTNDDHLMEIIVLATGGQETNATTTKRVPLSLMVFAKDFGTANKLTEKTTEFLKSLPALRGQIRWVEIQNSGEKIENPGAQELRNITAVATLRAVSTTIY